VSEEQDNELQRSAAVDQWGFTQASVKTTITNVMYAALPAWMARRWTVTMNGWRFSGGALPGGPTIPPVNQVGNFSIFVAVQYGVGEQQERVVMDYPRNGFSFSLPASTLSVSIQVPSVPFNVPTPPTLSGFMAPVPSSVRGSLLTAPTFTSDQTGVGLSRIQAPVRACGYRMLYQGPITAGVVDVSQLDSSGNTLCQDTSDGPGAGAINQLGAVMRQSFFPLHRDAAQIEVDNGGGALNFFVQWLLDLG